MDGYNVTIFALIRHHEEWKDPHDGWKCGSAWNYPADDLDEHVIKALDFLSIF